MSDMSNDWKPVVRIRALHTQVLVVAQTRIEGSWACYCGPVPGLRHDQEYQRVLEEGDKVPEDVARTLFPDFVDLPYAR